MERLDATIITAAIPDMATSLHATPVRMNLAVTAYVLAFAISIPVSGWFADRFGARRAFAAALAVFTLGSVACGAAQSVPMLVTTRAVQGFGGAMMAPVGRLSLLRSFPRRDLVKAMTSTTLPAIPGPVVGPLLGGLFTTYASCRRAVTGRGKARRARLSALSSTMTRKAVSVVRPASWASIAPMAGPTRSRSFLPAQAPTRRSTARKRSTSSMSL